MFKFSEFINESIKEYYISFEYNDEKVEFKSTIFRKIYTDTILWLYENGYKFDENVVGRKLYKKSEISKSYLNKGLLYQIPNEDLYMIVNVGNEQSIKYAIVMLKRFGVDSETIKTNCLKSSNDEDIVDIGDDSDDFETEKMTFIEAAQLILKQNDNTPMSANEIWEQIEDLDLVETSGVTPWASLLTIMLKSSDNGNVAKKYKTKLFHIVSESPVMFILINAEQEVQPASEDDELDLDLPTRASAFTLPEDEVFPFTHFRGVQSQEEREKVKSTEPIEPVDNPFRQSVCILGKSGRGKSTTIDNMLESYPNMKYDFIIPTASTTGLLAQFSPTSGKTGGGGYIPSRLGKMIMDARNNPEILYTAVFDECHKASIIEMINDELLQCISTERNKGNRFISLDTETESLFSGLKDYRGNLLLPDNFGFIFLSSKPDVITSNDDFFRRVNIYILKKVDDYGSIDYLDMVRETGKDKNGKPTYRLNEEYFIFVEGKSKEDIQQIEKLNDEE